jgi:hypothetical protein
MLEAIERLNNALNESAKRKAARELGVAIGTEIGTSATIYRTPEQIDAMSLAEIGAWGESVQMVINP